MLTYAIELRIASMAVRSAVGKCKTEEYFVLNGVMFLTSGGSSHFCQRKMAFSSVTPQGFKTCKNEAFRSETRKRTKNTLMCVPLVNTIFPS